jgi:hypothetical protein
VLVMSGFGGPLLNPYGFDATGRYTPPLWSTLAVIVGAALASVWRRQRLVALVLAAAIVAVNVNGVRSSDPLAAFQSPYWDKLPVDNGALLDRLRTEGIAEIWVNHWAGQPLMFDARAAGQRLIAYDWWDVQSGGIDRFPEYLPLVEQADRPAYVLVTSEPEPELERTLRRLGVRYELWRVGPYVVVRPTSRVVQPWEVGSAIDYRY